MEQLSMEYSKKSKLEFTNYAGRKISTAVAEPDDAPEELKRGVKAKFVSYISPSSIQLVSGSAGKSWGTETE